MKKKIFIVLVSLAILLTLIIVYFLNADTPINPPERLSSVSQNARWYGGVDGGSWIDIVEVKAENKFRIKIYYDHNGELATDATFILDLDCPIRNIDSLTLIKSIGSYDGEKILLNLPANGKRCSLKPDL